MASASTVHVSNIASKTDDKEIKDFFSFWYAAKWPIWQNKTWNDS